MSDGSNKPVIFISYCQKDRSWLDYVRSFFEPLARQCTLLLWDDENLVIGGDWRGDIYAALDECSVFILLLSRYSLASAFILEEEVPRILGRPKDTVRFCPVVVTPYYVRKLDWLDPKSRRPPGNKALSELLDAARDREMAVIAEQIDGLLETLSRKPIAAVHPPVKSIIPARQPVAFPSIVDYGRLPETPYKTLVGRDAELKRLDDAWVDEKTRVISLVAWGGAGKTSLVIEWLSRVRNDGYRDADAVLCWSFYSQGSGMERAASGEGFLDWALGKLKVKLDTTSSVAKGERLAEECSRRRVLLVLDGLEPLQYGSEGQQGALKDQGLRAFLRGLAMERPLSGHSLIVLTTRVAVYDLRKWQDSSAPLIDLGRLSDEASAALLADGGVTGLPEEIREAAHDFAGHALALSLLAGFLRLLHNGDVRQRIRIRALADDPKDSGHDQARRVIEAYENEWLAGEPVLLAIMYMVGLFDRPANANCLTALRSEPVIDRFTNVIVGLNEGDWRVAIARLREVRLIDPEDPSAPDALDAHPLVREWFGGQLKHANETAWKVAHGRLYEYLRDATKEGKVPTLEDLAPLYQAIAHGCRAGRYSEVRADVYRDRICRRRVDGSIEYYAMNKLGAYDSDLAAISWFFDEPYSKPTGMLSKTDQAMVLGQAAFQLRALGRLTEALPAMNASLHLAEAEKAWINAAIAASNVSDVEMHIGEMAMALTMAQQSLTYADRSQDSFEMLSKRAGYAGVLHVAGRRDEARRLFIEAERLQGEWQSTYPLLYSVQGYQYCSLLLAEGEYEVAYDRAIKILEWETESDKLIDRALVRLALGRANLGRVLMAASRSESIASRDTDDIHDRLGQAIDIFRAAASAQYVSNGLLARSAFRRCVGDLDGAARDLDEVEEIAEPGPMKSQLCDVALARSRLAFAKIEAFAPLSGLIERGPKRRVPLDPLEAVLMKSEAAKQLAIAVDYIKSCGYFGRDEELADLEAVLRGERKFVDLPPRV